MVETHTVGFQIHGDFITDHCRSLVEEGKPHNAWLILTDGLPGITIEQAAEVLSGRKKLEGVNDVDLLDDDKSAQAAPEFIAKLLEDAQEGIRLRKLIEGFRDVAGVCHMAYHPTIGRLGGAKRGSPAGLIDEKVAAALLGGDRIPNLLMQIFPKFTEKEWETYWEKNQDDMYELVSEVHPWTRKSAASDLAARSGLPTKVVEAVLNPPMPQANPKTGDIKKEDNGWILPDGKFYPCGFMGHGQLACDLGIDSADRGAEDLGWVRCGLSEMDGTRNVRIKRDKEPTQAQINKVADYCEAHDMELPEWAGGRGSGFKHMGDSQKWTDQIKKVDGD
jgi:hypothetical protein